MFAVGWLELKEAERAQQQLSKCFGNITEPFKVRLLETWLLWNCLSALTLFSLPTYVNNFFFSNFLRSGQRTLMDQEP